MKIKFITATIQNKMSENLVFKSLIDEIVRLLSNIDKIPNDQNAIFITIEQRKIGYTIAFHDGGATYDPNIDDMVYTYYSIKVFPNIIGQNFKLFYSLHEQILCFLNER